MIKDVRYNGVSFTPSDYECPDGDLVTAMGFIHEHDALRPILPPQTVQTLREGRTVICIHKIGTSVHYILEANYDEDGTPWHSLEYLCDGAYQEITELRDAVLRQVTVMGNTLIVLREDGMDYYLWSEEDGYIHLGSGLPECSLSFGLEGSIVMGEPFNLTFGSVYSDGGRFSDEDRSKVTSTVLAKVNSFIADKATSNGAFLFPFFVRYAYRLYDGSLSRHSAPVLMICSSGTSPQVASRIMRAENITSAQCAVYGMVCDLNYMVANASVLTTLKRWKDIIRSVDIFVSAPIYTYDQSGECESFGKTEPGYALCRTSTDTGYRKTNISEELSRLNNGFAADFAPVLPKKERDDIIDDIKGCNQFFLLKSIEIDNLCSERSRIEIPDEYLQSLMNREAMTDDYDSHDQLIPKYSYVYNSRLNIANLEKLLYEGYPSVAAFCCNDRPQNTAYFSTGPLSCYVYVKQDGRTIVVRNESAIFATDPWLVYFYYPNTNAFKAVICQSGYPDDMGGTYSKYAEIELKPHEYLNGAVYFGGWDGIILKEGDVSVAVSSDEERLISLPNKIYTSETNNPFYFPLLGINTVGFGEILGICSAVKAMSQGQFGQFPLYAFTSEGVWAMEVSASGSYSSVQPVTRDVCVNPESITQIDNSVLFATERGIMLVAGSESMCISDMLDNDETVSLATFTCGEELIEKAGFSADHFDFIPFKEFVVECRIIYDYTNQRLIIYNTGTLYAYVYSLLSKKWGMMASYISGHVQSYPQALAMTWDNALVDFSKLDDTAVPHGLIVTRPLKLDNADILKTVDTVIQRGVFRRGHVSTALFGSRDLFNWVLVFSSKDHYLRGFRGTPYKYFRIVLICSLDKGESIFGCGIQYTPRLLNQPR